MSNVELRNWLKKIAQTKQETFVSIEELYNQCHLEIPGPNQEFTKPREQLQEICDEIGNLKVISDQSGLMVVDKDFKWDWHFIETENALPTYYRNEEDGTCTIFYVWPYLEATLKAGVIELNHHIEDPEIFMLEEDGLEWDDLEPIHEIVIEDEEDGMRVYKQVYDLMQKGKYDEAIELIKNN